MKNEFLAKVFKWFGLGLLITFLVAFYTSTNIYLLSLIFNGIGYLIIILLELLCIYLDYIIHYFHTVYRLHIPPRLPI